MAVTRIRSVLELLLCCFTTLAIAQLPQQEVNAINAFRATVNPQPAQWANITEPCELHGIFCNTTNGGLHVLEIALSNSTSRDLPTSYKITASIGSWIGSLPYLTNLRLRDVNFTAPISNSLATLTNLVSIVIGGCNNLQLPTSFPASLGSLSISTSDLTKMPNIAGTTIGSLAITSCPKIVDSIPAHYASLPSLKLLFLTSLPGLTGSIPKFANQLYSITITNTGVSGQIPSISALYSLVLTQNALTGTIPASIFTSNVVTISLSSNQLTGPLPNTISSATSLIGLSINSNRFAGPFPTSLLALPMLMNLDLSLNNFTGSIPDFGQMNALNNLNLAYNQFSGAVPVFAAPNLKNVDLSGNQLSSLSAAALDAPSVSQMVLSYNQLSGTIPQIGSTLSVLTLDGNQFTGSVPFTDGLSLAGLSIAYNQLTGSIPMIGSSLTFFNAAGNRLSGFLPTIFGSDLNYLDLSDNQLYGDIPAVYNGISISALDLSNNLLSGCFNLSLPNLRACSLSKNFFCCVPEPCSVADLDCPNCPVPAPEDSALCQYDANRTPTWVLLGDLTITEAITMYNTVIYGDLSVKANISVTQGAVIDVKGCADIEGGLTLTLTPQEIALLVQNGTLTRNVITFNASCSNANLDFDSVSYEGSIPCTNTTVVQKNTPNSVAVVITSEKVTCPGDLEPWAIGVIVAACFVAAGAAIGIGFGVTKKKREREETRVRSRLSTAGSNPPVPQQRTSSTVELEHDESH